MTRDEVKRLKSLADRIKDRDVARFAQERARSDAIGLEVERIRGEIDQTILSGDDASNAAMHAVFDRWRIWAQKRLHALCERARKQQEIEESARDIAAHAAGRREALGVIGKRIAAEDALTSNRRAERDQSVVKLKPTRISTKLDGS